MKKLIIPCITLILTFILAISVSAESLPALHPAENIQTGVTEQMVAALTKTVPHIRLHPAEKLKTGFSAARSRSVFAPKTYSAPFILHFQEQALFFPKHTERSAQILPPAPLQSGASVSVKV